MPKIIVTNRYIKSGSHGKLGNYVKYIATREGVAIPQQHTELDREIFMNYLDSRPKSHGLFTGKDEPIVLDRAAKEVANHAGTVWMHIVSLRRDDAKRMGFNTLEAWRELVRRHISDIAAAQKISPQNIRWYAAFHNKETNPHVHIVVYSTDPKEGYLSNTGIEKIHSAFANDIYRDELQNLYQEQTQVRDKLRREAEDIIRNLVSELQTSSCSSPQLEILIPKLYFQLQKSKGKKIYGYLQPNVKKTVDEIVAELAKNPVLKKMYEEWCELERQKYETYTGAVQSFPALADNKAFKPIKNAVIRAVMDMDIPTEIEITMPSFTPDEIEEIADDTQEDISDVRYHMNWRDNYKTACSLLYDEDYEKAFALFQSEAEKVNVPAIYNVAKMYQRGLLGEENIPKAQEYYAEALKGFLYLESSAGKMQPYIWYNLGKLYNLGYGTQQNYSEAFKWFQKATLAGNSYAQYSLGGLYYFGNGVEQDRSQAFAWYKKSADQHNAYACYETAKMLQDGVGTKKNSDESEWYFREAYKGFQTMKSVLADNMLLYRLGIMTLKGIGCEAAPEKALDYLRKSAEMNNKYALCEYGKQLVDGVFLSQNVEKGLAMLKHSADLANTAASYWLGKMYLFGKGVERDTDMALYWLTMSAESGNEYAQTAIENMDHFYQSAIQNATLTMLKSFGRLISGDYNRITRGLKFRTEHKLKQAIHRKKAALGIKENPLEPKY